MKTITLSDKATLHTTLNLLRKHFGFQAECYRRMVERLGGVDAYGADTKINLLSVLESCGVDAVLMSLRATIEDAEIASKRLVIRFAEQSLPVFEKYAKGDDRPRGAVVAATRFLAGEIALDSLRVAETAARAAARCVALRAARGIEEFAGQVSAGAAAMTAVQAAGRVEAEGCARAAAWDVAQAAAKAIAGDAAGVAAGLAGAGRESEWDGKWKDEWEVAWTATWEVMWCTAQNVQKHIIRAELAADEVPA